jgi:excisionase family DNA binding protein
MGTRAVALPWPFRFFLYACSCRGKESPGRSDTLSLASACSPKGTALHCVPVPSDLIGPGQAAEILHVSDRTIRNMIRRGELTGYRVTSGLTKLSEAEVRGHVRVGPQGDRPDLDGYIRRIVDAAPALTPEQLERLRALLAPPTAA